MPASTLERLAGSSPARASSRPTASRSWASCGARAATTARSGSRSAARATRPRSSTACSGSGPRRPCSGYLNAGSPFDAEGWFNTQDAVEQDGEWLRFLGRTSDLINVGGQKVYPAEVESVLLEMDDVLDVTVRGEPNPIVGQCVVARVNLRQPEAAADFKARMRRHCQGRLAPYMIPVKVEIAAAEQFGARCKRCASSRTRHPPVFETTVNMNAFASRW